MNIIPELRIVLTAKMRRENNSNSANPRGKAIPLVRRRQKTELDAQLYENLLSNKLIRQISVLQ